VLAGVGLRPQAITSSVPYAGKAIVAPASSSAVVEVPLPSTAMPTNAPSRVTLTETVPVVDASNLHIGSSVAVPSIASSPVSAAPREVRVSPPSTYAPTTPPHVVVAPPSVHITVAAAPPQGAVVHAGNEAIPSVTVAADQPPSTGVGQTGRPASTTQAHVSTARSNSPLARPAPVVLKAVTRAPTAIGQLTRQALAAVGTAVVTTNAYETPQPQFSSGIDVPSLVASQAPDPSAPGTDPSGPSTGTGGHSGGPFAADLTALLAALSCFFLCFRRRAWDCRRPLSLSYPPLVPPG
jgi:hypothetical protein